MKTPKRKKCWHFAKNVIIVMKGQFSKGVLDVLNAFTNGMRVHGVIAISVNDIFW